MKLTNAMRNSFIAAVMQDVPMVDYEEQYRKLLQSASIGYLPALVYKAYLEYPEYIKTQNIWNHGVWNHGSGGVAVYGSSDAGKLLRDDKVLMARVGELARKLKKQTDTRNEVRAKVNGLACACSTVKQLVEAAPELAKYAPKDIAQAIDRSVPVVNVMKSLHEAGFPKGK